jgi:DNA-binding SARP family transcriptional activator/tetratricopeptide (TPR) repeat protein
VVSHFRLLTLGAPLLVTATGEAVRYRTRKHFALLMRLALEPGKRLAREYLIDLLWPDVPGVRGRHSLSQAVSVLRATIGRQFLLTQRASLALIEGVVDVDAHRLETCEAEIRGRFLEGFELRGARGFEEWRDAWAARLYPRIRDCLVRQMDAGRRIGDFASVEKHAQVLEELDPLSEDAVRGIIEARAWVGDRSNALKAFNRYATRLALELEAKASPELVRIIDLLREGRRAAPRPTADGVPPREERRFEAETIIGREREFSVLYDAWLDVRRRSPHVMVMLGDPGIGKTTLANAFVSSCQMEGGIIARAQAYDAERELPYAVLAELIQQLTLQHSIGAAEPEALSDLSRLTPEILSVFPGVPKPVDWPPEVVPLRLADAFLKAVSAAAEDNPVVLVIDDVHAADNASVAILHMLARKLDGLRLLLILTARQGDVRASTAARALITDAGIETLATLELETLSHDAAAVLVARVSAKGLDRWGEPPIARIVRSGGGNPLALELLSREWVARGNQSLIGMLDALNALPAPALSLPQAVKAVYARQTQQLDDRSRAVLDLAAVLARRMGDLRFYQIIGCSEGEALSRLSQLLETRLLREVAGQLEFRNELVRAHAYYEVPSTLRLELHRRVAKLLERLAEDQPPHELEIAWHYIIGRDPHSAARYALAGAERSLTEGAPREAELILRALSRDQLDPQTSRQAMLVLGSALMGQSKAEEALPLLEELLADEQLPKREMARAVRLYASAMYLLNRNSTAKHSEIAERALQVARECGDNELLAHALFECARAGVESGRVELVATCREELHRTLISPSEDVPPIAYFADAYCSHFLLDIEQALESAQRAVTGLATRKNIGELALGYNALGNCEMAGCRFEEALEAYSKALTLWKTVGDDYRMSLTHYNLGATHMMGGDFNKAVQDFQESLAIGKRAPAQPVLSWTWSSLALAHLVQDQRSSAIECLEALKHWMQSGRSWVMNMEYYCGAAEIELAIGNENEALRLISQAEQELQGRGYLFISQGTLERLRVFLAYHTQGPEAATSLAEEFMNRFRGHHQLAHLEAVAALAWIERKMTGRYSTATERELQLFDKHRAAGKRAILIAQGFLE